MREILFKAKRIEDGKWIEGYYQKRYGFFGNEEHLIFRADSYAVWGYAEIAPETLCQFTGLYDKNGKNIWENDILMDEFCPEAVTYGTVEWNFAGWVLHESDSIDREFIDEFVTEYYEVAGNVFDNPELLQEESDE
mgnify:CR=1 FL=1